MEEEILDKLLSDPVVIDDSPALNGGADDRKLIFVSAGSTTHKFYVGPPEETMNTVKAAFGICSTNYVVLWDKENVVYPIQCVQHLGSYKLAQNRGIPSTRKFITVKYGVNTRKVRIDGTNEAIKEAIKSMFNLRTNRLFWLEDEEHVACPLDPAMKPGNYTLCVDRGISIKVRFFDDGLVPVYTETLFFQTEEDYISFLTDRQYRYLEECDGIQKVAYHMDDLQDGVLYRGIKI